MFDVNENGEAVETLEKEKKKPVIKGYSKLRWTGKRLFNGGTFYPAQLKETYGSANERERVCLLTEGHNFLKCKKRDKQLFA